ncbi:MAG: phosphatidate cytidylyltransferase [Candidatus Caldatribacteriota bacterium]|nr:phosphatidate cytidylyltransferase [Candidatus Caldatribacteriota bacterium]
MEVKYKTLLKRIIVIIFGIPILSFLVLWKELPFLITIIIFDIFGLHELYNMFRKKGHQPSILFGTIFSLYFIYLSTYSYGTFNIKISNLFIITIFILLYLLTQLFRKNNSAVLTNISITIFGSIYIGYLSTFLLKIKYLANGNIYLISLFIIVWTNDVAAYIIGTVLGRTKLAPKISPMKTIEGSIGGIIFSIISVFVLNNWLNYDFGKALFIGIIISVIAQCGDLFESLLKRSSNIKDSGNVIPGHGGVLDRFDSLLFAAPVFYFCIMYIKQINL